MGLDWGLLMVEREIVIFGDERKIKKVTNLQLVKVIMLIMVVVCGLLRGAIILVGNNRNG